MSKVCFVNNRYQKIEEGAVRADDIGILRGYGVFDYIRTYGGEFFLIDKHVDRFFSSAETLNLNIDLSKKKIKEIAYELKEKNNLKECAVRLIATGGKTIKSRNYGKNSTFIALCRPIKTPPENVYEQGAELLTLEYKRPLPEAKHNNYLLPLSQKERLEKEGKFDFLYIDEGVVFESVTSNFFLVKEGKIITPQKGILRGVTRGVVIDLIKDKFEFEERTVTLKELKAADEAFLTSTSKEVLPVTRVDNFEIGSGEVGELTKEAMLLFKKKVENFKK